MGTSLIERQNRTKEIGDFKWTTNLVYGTSTLGAKLFTNSSHRASASIVPDSKGPVMIAEPSCLPN
jgi:hypothetical protein